MDQHVIPEWLLEAFARPGAGGRTIQVFDKGADQYDTANSEDFMVEVDAHPADVEADLTRIETRAAQAALRLAKRAKALPPGVYAVVPADSPTRSGGPAALDGGVLEGVRLLVSEHLLPSPRPEDRLALGTFVGMMYQRSPKVEASIRRFGAAYDQQAQRTLDRLVPGMRTGLETELNRRRSRISGLASSIGSQLAESAWWVVRPERNCAFVLGDCPVAVTISLGHNDRWRPILGGNAHVVAMPLGPSVALLIAPQRVMFITGIEATVSDITLAINRLIWRHADRAVLARRRSDLEAVWPPGDDGRLDRVEVEQDLDATARAADRDTTRIVASAFARLVPWPPWTGCRLDWGRPRPAAHR